MKRLLVIVLPLLLIVGCSSPEPINYKETLNERDDVYYTKDTNKPYSGPVFSLYKDGKNKGEGSLKDGKKDGLWTQWYENGQKKNETSFKDGKEDGLFTIWYDKDDDIPYLNG
ncbi:MAG: toxin-antitoxin system YwqK family antitoxin, partial [Candidatus Neomarinimicrobiota bacterium]|nr:toxin-antitoxin system YwqK family antitoxin [Candidatus Neomarinimicrobiota bacterium]